ncbi:hypothetical protein VCHA37P199_30285 [Vibrio chagasii]|nr:hypothetical protein VCHA37P199_30285 [Vibrio chagasii]
MTGYWKIEGDRLNLYFVGDAEGRPIAYPKNQLLESGKLLVSKIHSEPMIYDIASLSILINTGNATHL